MITENLNKKEEKINDGEAREEKRSLQAKENAKAEPSKQRNVEEQRRASAFAKVKLRELPLKIMQRYENLTKNFLWKKILMKYLLHTLHRLHISDDDSNEEECKQFPVSFRQNSALGKLFFTREFSSDFPANCTEILQHSNNAEIQSDSECQAELRRQSDGWNSSNAVNKSSDATTHRRSVGKFTTENSARSTAATNLPNRSGRHATVARRR